MYVLSQDKYRTVYERKDGTRYYMLDGKRHTVRSNQNIYDRKSSTACGKMKKSGCEQSNRCSWVKNRGCRKSASRKSASRKSASKSATLRAQASPQEVLKVLASREAVDLAISSSYVSASVIENNGSVRFTLKGSAKPRSSNVSWANIRPKHSSEYCDELRRQSSAGANVVKKCTKLEPGAAVSLYFRRAPNMKKFILGLHDGTIDKGDAFEIMYDLLDYLNMGYKFSTAQDTGALQFKAGKLK